MIGFVVDIKADRWLTAPIDSRIARLVACSCATGRVSQFKMWQVEFGFKTLSSLCSLVLDLRLWGRDHAGPSLELTLFGFYADFLIYDVRHWDYETNMWSEVDDQ